MSQLPFHTTTPGQPASATPSTGDTLPGTGGAPPAPAIPAPVYGLPAGLDAPAAPVAPSAPVAPVAPAAAPVARAKQDLDLAWSVVQRLRGRARHAVVGRDAVIDLCIVALLADGHVLLEDFPGSGKTTLAKSLGDAIVDQDQADAFAAMRRIQFTPDMLPSDITGTTIFDPETAKFFYRPGPLFAHIVLADEINRTSPKVQAALLEAMGEKQVTVDNETRRLDDVFFVIATQNPLDLAGTFPLPSAQLDRFLFKIRMEHIPAADELRVLRTRTERRNVAADHLPRVTRDELVAARVAIENRVHVDGAIEECLVNIASRTRADDRILLGTSTRSLVLSIPALQVRALMQGRDWVSPEDVEYLAPYLFAHRIEPAPGVQDVGALVRDCARPALETLSRTMLQNPKAR